jgi:hypothetical protein
LSQCTNPALNTTGTGTTTLQVGTQTGAAFTGTSSQSEPGVVTTFTFTGTTTSAGQIGGSFTLSSSVTVRTAAGVLATVTLSSAGSWFGSVLGPSLFGEFQGPLTISGDRCQLSGSFSSL